MTVKIKRVKNLTALCYLYFAELQQSKRVLSSSLDKPTHLYHICFTIWATSPNISFHFLDSKVYAKLQRHPRHSWCTKEAIIIFQVPRITAVRLKTWFSTLSIFRVAFLGVICQIIISMLPISLVYLIPVVNQWGNTKVVLCSSFCPWFRNYWVIWTSMPFINLHPQTFNQDLTQDVFSVPCWTGQFCWKTIFWDSPHLASSGTKTNRILVKAPPVSLVR